MQNLEKLLLILKYLDVMLLKKQIIVTNNNIFNEENVFIAKKDERNDGQLSGTVTYSFPFVPFS